MLSIHRNIRNGALTRQPADGASWDNRIAIGAQRKEVLSAALGRAGKITGFWFGQARGLLLGLPGDPGALVFIAYQAIPAIRWYWLACFAMSCWGLRQLRFQRYARGRLIL